MVARRLQHVCTYGVKAMVVARDCARAGPTWSPRGTLETFPVDDQTTHYYNDASDKPVTVDGPGYNVTHTYDALDRLAQRDGVNLGYAELTNNAVRMPTPDSDALIFRGPDGTPLSDKSVLASGISCNSAELDLAELGPAGALVDVNCRARAGRA